jgi:hypothetical protein
MRHSCEGRNPENNEPKALDARLRGHDVKNTPISELINFMYSIISKGNIIF